MKVPYRSLKILFGVLTLLAGGSFTAKSAEVSVEGWKSVELWRSDTISARLRFLPSASLADRYWIGLELENHTSAPIKIDQIVLHLDGTRFDKLTGKPIGYGGIGGGTFRATKVLPVGLTRVFDQALDYSSANLRLLPENGFKVQALAHCRLDIYTPKQRFSTPEEKVPFEFDWRYPSAAELARINAELKDLLSDHASLRPNLPRMTALFGVPSVKESLTLDEMLPALKATRDHNVRYLLLPKIFERFANAPPVLEYYREAFRTDPEQYYWDASNPIVWNSEFLEPMVQGCEKNWYHFHILSRHPAQWKHDPHYVGRLYAALFKHHPILSRDLKNVGEKELPVWYRAITDGSKLGDRRLIPLLKPALDDRRLIVIEDISSGRFEMRVCDAAVNAILDILDGNWYAAFTKAGLKPMKGSASFLGPVPDVSQYDRMIELLKERVKTP